MKPLIGRRILIAEDEALIALELEGMLEDLGCTVVGPVSEVADVITHAETGTLHGALLDVNLRGEQIFSALPRLTELSLPFIITSGYGDSTLFPVEFRSAPRVPKPIDEAALRQLCVNVFLQP